LQIAQFVGHVEVHLGPKKPGAQAGQFPVTGSQIVPAAQLAGHGTGGQLPVT